MHPTAPLVSDPLIRLFTPSHPALVGLYETPEEQARLLKQAIADQVQAALDFREDKAHREKRVNSQQGAAELNITERHLLRLRRRGEVVGTRMPGTRRYYFLTGDLLDWKIANTREDGGLKHTARCSAPGGKKEGGK